MTTPLVNIASSSKKMKRKRACWYFNVIWENHALIKLVSYKYMPFLIKK
jgi:hypothetical protein